MSILGNNGTGKLVQRPKSYLVREILSGRWYRIISLRRSSPDRSTLSKQRVPNIKRGIFSFSQNRDIFSNKIYFEFHYFAQFNNIYNYVYALHHRRKMKCDILRKNCITFSLCWRENVWRARRYEIAKIAKLRSGHPTPITLCTHMLCMCIIRGDLLTVKCNITRVLLETYSSGVRIVSGERRPTSASGCRARVYGKIMLTISIKFISLRRARLPEKTIPPAIAGRYLSTNSTREKDET